MKNTDPVYLAAKEKVHELSDKGWSPVTIHANGGTGLDKNQIAGIVHRHQKQKLAASGGTTRKRRRNDPVGRPAAQLLERPNRVVGKGSKAQTERQATASKEAASKARKHLIDSVVVPAVTVDLSPEALAPHLYKARPYQKGDELEKSEQ